jgi:hypothetical protein
MLYVSPIFIAQGVLFRTRLRLCGEASVSYCLLTSERRAVQGVAEQRLAGVEAI